jgi:predicted Fe-Mo cluster-binding NifX family protein
MKVGIPFWENKVSPVLDTASRLLVVETEGGRVISRFELYLDERDLAKRGLRIQGLGLETLICGAVTRHFSDMLTSYGIHIVSGISGQPDEVLGAWFSGKLGEGKFLMPGWSKNNLQEQLSTPILKSGYKPKSVVEW